MFRRPAGMEVVPAESIDVRRLIRTERRQHLVGDLLALCFQEVNRQHFHAFDLMWRDLRGLLRLERKRLPRAMVPPAARAGAARGSRGRDRHCALRCDLRPRHGRLCREAGGRAVTRPKGDKLGEDQNPRLFAD